MSLPPIRSNHVNTHDAIPVYSFPLLDNHSQNPSTRPSLCPRTGSLPSTLPQAPTRLLPILPLPGSLPQNPRLIPHCPHTSPLHPGQSISQLHFPNHSSTPRPSTQTPRLIPHLPTHSLLTIHIDHANYNHLYHYPSPGPLTLRSTPHCPLPAPVTPPNLSPLYTQLERRCQSLDTTLLLRYRLP